MTTSLMNLWSRSMDIATGSPEVMVRRIGGMMNPAVAWTPAAAIEVQCMLLEKMEATVESGWAMVRGALALSTPSTDSMMWWLPAQQKQMADKVAGAAQQVLLPVSERVNANVERLRNT